MATNNLRKAKPFNQAKWVCWTPCKRVYANTVEVNFEMMYLDCLIVK